MKRITRALVLGVTVAALAACSHKDKNAPLSYVPADTPYLIGNLKPLDKDTRKALLSSAELQKSVQTGRLNDMADKFAKEDKNDLANLLRYSANYLDQHSYAEIEADSGVDPDGLFAIYGLGLSPVGRGQLDDADKFDKWVAGFEKAYGHEFAKDTLDKVTYQHLALGDSNLQLLISHHDKSYVMALLPADADQKTLRQVLGLDKPENSAQDKQVLKKLADANGYDPYVLSYVDITRLPALVAGGKDPLLKALLAAGARHDGKQAGKLMEKLPASCEPDLSRIAARVPMISSGYTKISAKDTVQQMDVRLAPDIVQAFKGIGGDVPGLGDDPTKAMLDVTLALPVPKVRDFWLAQAEAVKAKPFTCPALVSINDMAGKAQQYLPRMGIPPLGDLRGLRLVVDQYDANDNSGASPLSDLRARVMIASKNPEGLLNIAKAMLPPLAQLKVEADGKPVAVPDTLRQQFKVQQPAWVAVGKQALAIGIGKDEKDPLPGMLDAGTGKQDTLVRSHVDGSFYAKWLGLMQKQVAKQTASTGDAEKDAKVEAEMARTRKDLETVQQAMQQIDGISTRVRMTDHGLRTHAETHLK